MPIVLKFSKTDKIDTHLYENFVTTLELNPSIPENLKKNLLSITAAVSQFEIDANR